MPHSFGLSLLFTNFAENVNLLIMKLWPKHLVGNSYFIAISSFPLRSASIVASLAVRYFFDRSSFGNRRTNEGRTKDERWSIEEPSKVERKTIEGRTKNERETIEDRSRNNRENHDPLLRFVRDPFGIRSGCSRCKESKKKLCGQEKWSRV